MINSTTPVALVVSTQAEIQFYMQALGECGFKRVTAFTSAKEAYEVCTRQQFPLFITRMEIPDMSGIVLIQKLRMTGNYGLEPHLFICEKLDSKLLNVLAEYDLDYILVPPLTKASVIQKFKHMVATENSLSATEIGYRDAKAAFAGNLLEMAEENIKGVLSLSPQLEKALLLHGDIKAKQNDPNSARQLYKSALTANPKSATAAHKLAALLMAQGEHAQAADLYNRLAELNPYNIKLLENAGLSNFNVERYEEAKAHMGKLAGIDETNRTAATVTAEIKIKSGEFDGMVDVLKKSMGEKEIIQFLNNAGAKLSQGSDIDGALKMYATALTEIPDSKFLYAIHFNMGIAYKKKNVADKAIFHLEKAIKLKPDFEKAQATLNELKRQAA